MHLHHLHLPALTPYIHASHIQSLLVRHHLSFLKTTSPKTLAHNAPSQTFFTQPPPYLLTFTPSPIYTTGRRDYLHLSDSQITHLTSPTPHGSASFEPSLRGGQTTFHGPGQLVAYLIAHLPSHGLNTRSHIWLLEEAVVRTLALYRVNGFRSAEYPGVWVTGPGTGTGLGSSAGEDLARHSGGGHRDYGGEDGEEKKIASVGVRLRRYVSSYGIALNISTDLSWFERIVACGLPGNKVTSMERLGCKFGVGVEEVAEVFEGVVVGLLGGVEGVKRIGEEDVLALEKVVGEEATKEVEG